MTIITVPSPKRSTCFEPVHYNILGEFYYVIKWFSSRILDVKYFILLPSVAEVGMPVDLIQWSALGDPGELLEVARAAPKWHLLLTPALGGFAAGLVLVWGLRLLGNPGLSNLMLDPFFKNLLNQSQQNWRETVALAISNGIPVPAFSASLGYYDSYRAERLPANLLQAQRDFFGAHTYERLDKPAGQFFHTDWPEVIG